MQKYKKLCLVLFASLLLSGSCATKSVAIPTNEQVNTSPNTISCKGLVDGTVYAVVGEKLYRETLDILSFCKERGYILVMPEDKGISAEAAQCNQNMPSDAVFVEKALFEQIAEALLECDEASQVELSDPVIYPI